MRNVSITCGIDWAEAHHDVALFDDAGRVVVHARIDTGVPGFTQPMGLLAEHAEDPAAVPAAIETDKNLLVVALQAAGLTAYPINPRAVARYREWHSQSGKKSDPGDAAVLADVLRTDRHQHRPLPVLVDERDGHLDGRSVKSARGAVSALRLVRFPGASRTRRAPFNAPGSPQAPIRRPDGPPRWSARAAA
jgi:hypothetical protein